MNKLRYVIEWRIGIYDERDDVWTVVWGEWNREIFEDDVEFRRRLSEVNTLCENKDDSEICLYSCELQDIRG